MVDVSISMFIMMFASDIVYCRIR